MPLLQLEGVSKRFGQVVVADGITFQLEEGASVGVVGPNGAGKTSMFAMISGDIKADSGHVRFGDHDLARVSTPQRCRMGIGRTYQIPQPFEHMTVFENALLAAQQGARIRGRESYDAAYRALERAGLAALANRPAGSLALLHRKRLELARALATNPRILLLDEIAGGLTESECQDLVALISAIHAEGVSIIWIEHVVHALLSVAERLVVLNFGKLIVEGKPQEVMESREVRSVYLGEGAHV